MSINKALLPQEIYHGNLHIISGVKFSQREIEVITCILHVRTAKKMAALLSISPKTIESHIRNITQRLECNSREGIVDFIEKSDKYLEIKSYYSHLLILKKFEETLLAISKETSDKGLSYVIACEEKTENGSVLPLLKKHLSLLGLENIPISSKSPSDPEDPSKIFITPPNNENYYLYFFHFLESFFPYLNISSYRSIFKEQCERLLDPHMPSHRADKTEPLKYNRPKLGMIGLLGIAALILGGLVYFKYLPQQEDSVVRSDLIIPSDTTLLSRQKLVEEIDNKLSSQNAIQNIALIGVGGSGKTTLARQYARSQKTAVVWEINAETLESRMDSLESFARALSSSEEESRLLKNIRDIKNPREKQDKMLLFIKKKLRSGPEWLLIFDNVEKFSDIQPYFPSDPTIWGKGKVILTTRDSHIQQNNQVKATVAVGELSPQEKSDLFTKIINNKKSLGLSAEQKREEERFLEKLPPFPLDISTAAYYLKSTHIPYAAYLESISQHHKDFLELQENLLKESGDYTRTRYNIIAFSLKKMIDTHKDFESLLLFISLLDSQNIPKELLINFKNTDVVNNFMYHLKKYSLITSESSNGASFSLHRSMQQISLAYLKNIEGKDQLLQEIANSLWQSVMIAIEKEDLLSIKIFFNHCEAFLTHKFLNENIKGTIGSALGSISYFLGSTDEAKKILEESLSFLNTNYKGNLQKIAPLLIYLGASHREIGDFEKAKQLLMESLFIYKNYLPENQIEAATAFVHLGMVYRGLGNHEKARDLFEQGIVIYKKHLPENHPRISWSLGHLGIEHSTLGHHKRADALLNEGLLIYKKYSPEAHTSIAQLLWYLGIVYNRLGEYEKARNHLEQANVLFEEYSPEDFVSFSNIYAQLGNAYRGLGDFEKARKLLEASILIHNKHSSKYHKRYARLLSFLGCLDKDTDNYEKAKSRLQESLLIYEKLFGKESIDSAYVLNILGEVYLLENQFEMAESSFNKALKIFEHHNHTDIYLSLESLADFYSIRLNFIDKKKEAEKHVMLKDQAIHFLIEALEKIKTQVPENSPHCRRIESKIEKLKMAS